MARLKHDGENDYTLVIDNELPDAIWITVKNLSAYVIQTDEGVIVDIYPLEKEAEGNPPMASTYAFFNEA